MNGDAGTAVTDGAGGGRLGVARIAGAATLIAGFTLLARIAGFGRTYVFMHTVTGNDLGDAYNAANIIPNIVFELVAGGALASLVVPLLAGAVVVGDRARVNATVSALLTWVLALMVPFAVLVAVAAAPIAALLPDITAAQPDITAAQPDITAAQRDIVARMLVVFAPQLPLYGVGIVLTGVLQAHRRFVWPVIAPLLSSVTVMAAYGLYALLDGRGSDVDELTPGGELALSVGTTLGVAVLSLCLVIPISRLGLRLRPTLRFPGEQGRQAVRLGWAGAVTVCAQQIVIAIVVALAFSEGLSEFITAQTVFLLPWAVLAVPAATAVYPNLAGAVARGDTAGYRAALAGTARSVVLLAGLGAAALAALATPAARIVGEPPDAPGIAEGIVGFAPGLFGYALFALLSRALYARGATVAAAGATAAGWAVAAPAAYLLSMWCGVEHRVFSLSLANALGMSVIGLLLARAVRRHAGTGALAGLGRATGVGIVAAGTAAGAGWATVTALAGSLPGALPGGLVAPVQGMLGGVVVVAVFAATAYLTDRRYVAPLLAAVHGRLRRGRTPTPDSRTPRGTPDSRTPRGEKTP